MNRDHTLSMKGVHVKDLSRLNRDLARTIIIDNSPESYLLQPENAIPIKSFFGDNNDTSLLDLIPFLKDIVLRDVQDVRAVLKKCHIKVDLRTGFCLCTGNLHDILKDLTFGATCRGAL